MAENGFFKNISSQDFSPDAVLDLSAGGRALILSDLHMGYGKRDDLAVNGDLIIGLLEKYYYEQGWYLVLNGDIEELQRYSLDSIVERWERLFRVFSLFAGKKRLYKLIGNHDEELLLKKSYYYPLYSVIRIDTGVIPVYVYHGHQSSQIYSNYNKLLGTAIRYVLKPFGIKNISSARNPHRQKG